jgi:hypothetical protein
MAHPTATMSRPQELPPHRKAPVAERQDRLVESSQRQ